MDQCVWLLIRVLKEKGLLSETEFSWLDNAWKLKMSQIAALSEDQQRAFIRDFVMQIPFEEYRKMFEQTTDEGDADSG